jgi:hypothetical protein
MAVAYVGAGASAFTITGADLTLTLPAGLTAGDAMVISVGTVDRIPTTPPGWTALGNNLIEVGNRQSGWVYYKIAGAGETSATLASTQAGTGTNKNVEAIMYAWRGVNPGTPIDAALAWGTLTTATNIPTPALTTLTANAEAIFLGFSQFNALWTPPAGATRQSEVAISAYVLIAADQPVAVPGLLASANFTATSGGTSNRIAGLAFASIPASQPSTRGGAAGQIVAAIAQARNAERKASQEHGRPPEPGRPPATGRRTRLDYLHKRGRPS